MNRIPDSELDGFGQVLIVAGQAGPFALELTKCPPRPGCAILIRTRHRTIHAMGGATIAQLCELLSELGRIAGEGGGHA